MAKNWTMAEAVRAIRENDKEGIIDLGKRFPLVTVILAQLNEAGVALCNAIPEYVNVRKIEAELKGEAEDVTDDVEEVKPVKPVKTVSKDEIPEPTSWKKMSIYHKGKAKEYGEEYVAACKALDEEEEKPAKKQEKPIKKLKKAAEKKAEPEDDDDDFDDDDEEEVKPKKAKKVVEEEDDDDDFDDFDFDDDDE